MVSSLALLPEGTALFEDLPARAIVLDALAPAVGNGVITLADDGRIGVLVVHAGAVSDAVCIDAGTRSSGTAALARIRSWEPATMSAYRWTDAAMSLVDPLIHGEPCYDDLRLEWTAWPQLLDDLRARGQTFVVELFTPAGRGVTVVRGGEQVATYTESEPSIGNPEAINALAAGGTGSIRVLAASTTATAPMVVTTSFTEDASLTPQPGSLVGHAPVLRSIDDDDVNATLSSLFGAHLRPLIVLDNSRASAATNAATLRPELKLLAQRRLQRSSRPVEDIVDAAADDRQTVAWLADRVRVTRIRGFMASTFEQLAEDMLALTERS
jgi:hypothetical protein